MRALVVMSLGLACSVEVDPFPPVARFGGAPPASTATVASEFTVNWDLLGSGRLAWSDHVKETIVVADASTRQVTTLRFAPLREGSALTFWTGSLALSPGAQQVSFAANMDWSWPSRVFVTPVAGGATVPLARVDLQCTSPFWASDGRAIFFLTGVTNGDGSQSDAVARAAPDGMQFSQVLSTAQFPGDRLWGPGSASPDGARIVLAAPDDGIYVAPIGGGSPTRISASPVGRFEYGPVWSPDGARIAFVSNAGSVSAGSETDGPFDLVVMAADGSDRTIVASLPAGVVCRPFVAWGPAGDKIAFNSCQFDDDNSAPVYILDVASGSAAPLTSGGGLYADGPSWVP